MHGAELGRGALLLVVQALDVLGLVGVNCLKVFDFLLQCVQFLFRSESLLRELLFEGHEAELGVLGGASFTTQKSLVRLLTRYCERVTLERADGTLRSVDPLMADVIDLRTGCD